MSKDEPGPLLGRGKCAEVFAWKTGTVLKLFYENMGGMAEREYKAALSAFKNGLPVPAVEELVEVNGRSGIVMERLDGRSMLEYIISKPLEILSCAGIMAEMQADMHVKRVDGLRSLEEVVESVVTADTGWPDVVKEATLAALQRLPRGNTSCHWDLHPGNIVMTGDGPVIIDWSETVLGNPLADAAMTWVIMSFSSVSPDGIPWFTWHFLRHIFYLSYLKRYKKRKPFSNDELTLWKVPVLEKTLRQLDFL